MADEAMADVAMADQHARVVDRLREAKLEDLRLQATLEEIALLEREDVIKLRLALVKHAQTLQPAQQAAALEDALRVLLIQSEQSTGGLADASQHQLVAPHLTLVAQAILTNELHLIVKALLLERTARRTTGLAVVAEEGEARHASSFRWSRTRVCGVSNFPHSEFFAARAAPQECSPPQRQRRTCVGRFDKGLLRQNVMYTNETINGSSMTRDDNLAPPPRSPCRVLGWRPPNCKSRVTVTRALSAPQWRSLVARACRCLRTS